MALDRVERALRRRGRAVSLVVLLLALGLAAPGPASAGSPAGVSGVVTDVEGHAVAGIEVLLESGTWLGVQLTDANGHYAFVVGQTVDETGGVLQAGSGQLHVRESVGTWPRRYVYFDAAVTIAAEPVTQDVVLHRYATVTGTLTDAEGGGPAEASIELYRDDDSSVAHANSATDGSYLATAWTPGSTRVGFATASGESLYAPLWYDGATSPDAATHLDLAEDDVVTVDATLSRGAVVSGTVTGQPGQDVTRAQVLVFNDSEPSLVTRAGSVAEDGSFSVTGLAPGAYRVVARERLDVPGVWASWYYQTGSVFPASTTVHVTAAGVTGVEIPLYGPTSATITAEDGDPASGVISLDNTRNADPADVVISIGGAPTNVSVAAHGTTTVPFGRLAGWTEIDVMVGGATIAAYRVPKSSISGTVRDSRGTPVTDASVRAVRTGDSAEYSGWVDDDGSYTITPAPGEYVVMITENGRTWYYDGVESAGAATPLTIGAEGTWVTGVDFVVPGAAASPERPGAPTAAATSSTQVRLTWQAPEDGGSPITGYTVRTYRAGTEVTSARTTTTGRSATVAGLSADTAYRFTVAATNAVGTSAESEPSQSVTTYAAAPVVTTTPARLVSDMAVPPRSPRCLQVAGARGIPGSVTGVLVNVTTVAPSGVGYVVVYPDSDGTGRTAPPAGSTVNFEPGSDVANATFVEVPADGRICYSTAGASRVGVILDVSGYLLDGSGVTTQAATRLLDTRSGRQHVGQVTGPVAPHHVYTVDVVGHAGVPSDATAVLLNVTVTGVRAVGNLRVYPAGQAVPRTSVLNYAAGRDKANGTVVALPASGRISFWSDTPVGGVGNPVQVVVDVVGYISGTSPYTGTAPTRVLDTRAAGSHVGPISGPVQGRRVYSVPMAGVGPVPADARAVVLNVTAIRPSAPGNLRVYPDIDGTRATKPPSASSINYISGRDIPNQVIVALPADGVVDLYSDSAGAVDLAIDVVGYVAATG